MTGKMNLKTHIQMVAGCAFLLLFPQCVEPFHPELDESEASPLLVVEGLITDQTGPFGVRLSSTLPVYDQPNGVTDFPLISGAEVQISDDAGHLYILPEKEAGWYETEEQDLRGIPGNTYYLTISTLDGLQYESSGVLMQEVPPIDSVYFKEGISTYFEKERVYTTNYLEIQVDTRAPDDEIRYYKWEFEETWEMEMPTYIRVDHGTGEGDPSPTMEHVEVDYERRHCYVSERSRSVLVHSTLDTPAEGIKGFVLQSIGPPDDRLNIRYSILVKQYVMDSHMYGFFRKIRESNEETGGIYEKAPAKILGNISCCNGDKQALGYFMASAEQQYRIFIQAGEHRVPKGSVYAECGWTSSPPRGVRYIPYGTYNNGSETALSRNSFCTDCRARGSHEKPDFWDQ